MWGGRERSDRVGWTGAEQRPGGVDGSAATVNPTRIPLPMCSLVDG